MPCSLDAPLVDKRPLEGAYVLLTFRHPEVARDARPGQFVMMKAGVSSEPPLRRPFSLMAVDPASDTFTVFLKAVGAGSRALSDLRPGEVAQCLGPLGRRFPDPPEHAEALLVAGGYGIAPFYFLSRELVDRGARARVFYGGRTVADLQIRDRFAGLGVPLAATTDDGSHGHHGRVTEALEAYLDTTPGAVALYACGPDAMLRAVSRVAEKRALPASVSLDPWMGCGIGTCLGCVVRIQRRDEERPHHRCACTEGPVFEASEVVWPDEEVSRARRLGMAEVEA
jgi:dihydroorotate dehydrogenase electron transfer subunit